MTAMGSCKFLCTPADRTRQCRGGACPSRRNAADTNGLPLKRYALPNCHCEEAAGRRGNLVQAVTILPIAFLQFSLVLRDSHVASLLGMTNLGAGAVDGNAFKFVTALGAQGAPLQTQSAHAILSIP